jgi:hypothetical protein
MLREKHRLRIYERGVVGGIFGPKLDELIRRRRKVNKEEYCNLGLHSSPEYYETDQTKENEPLSWLGFTTSTSKHTNLERYYWTSPLGVDPRSFVDRYQNVSKGFPAPICRVEK